jgi:hypothetical protein
VYPKRQKTAALQNAAVLVSTHYACVLECGGAPPLFERIMRGHGTAEDIDQRPSYERRIFKVRQSRYKRQFVQEYGRSADRRQRLQKFGVEIDPRAGEGD